MDWKSDLRRTQSLKSISSSTDKPIWTETRLRDRTSSVSQLVSRYQTTVTLSTSVQESTLNNAEVKQKQVIKEVTPSNLESLLQRNEEREHLRAKTSLTRSKSLSSLQNTAGSIGTLKALFESKATTQNQTKSGYGNNTAFKLTHNVTGSKPVMNGELEGVQRSSEERKAKIPGQPLANVDKTDANETVPQKVVNQSRSERRKTVGGIDFEKLAASQADEKRRSIADYRDSSILQTKDKLSVSVKAMSALYLSKVGPQDSAGSVMKQAQESSGSGKRGKLIKFQPASREMCSACLKPVYSMEKITTDKYIFHKTCFCCKQCKKKLSMQNYAPLYGEFYCIFHYKQLFRRKGNYDEGFGRPQHKNRWLFRDSTDICNESESEA